MSQNDCWTVRRFSRVIACVDLVRLVAAAVQSSDLSIGQARSKSLKRLIS